MKLQFNKKVHNKIQIDRGKKTLQGCKTTNKIQINKNIEKCNIDNYIQTNKNNNFEMEFDL